ncbi:MAG: hypothetical protein ABR498_03365 [Candidatus Dormibacteria bacterium]
MRFRRLADTRAAVRGAGGAMMFGACVASCGSCGASSTARVTPAPTTTVATSPTGVLNTPPAATSGQGATGANGTYTVNVSVNGTDNVQGSFIEPLTLSNSSAHCPVPSDITGDVSGKHIELQMPMNGAPTGQSQALSPGDLQLIIGSNTWGVASASNAPHGTSGTLKRNADGSGAADFQGLSLQSNPAQQPQESGAVTWSCA